MINDHNSKKDVRERFSSPKDLSKIHVIPAVTSSAANGGKNIRKRVAVYCRVSTDSIDQTTSFETQKLYYIDYVRKNPDWKLVGLYSDEGLSATTIRNRKGLQMLIRDALSGKIDLVITKDVSRFCRNAEDFRRIVREFRSLADPVEIYFETEKLSTADPAMDLAITLVAIFVEQESVRKSEMITGAVRQRFGEGLFLVPASLGYDRTGVNLIDVNEDEAETVKLIYDMYLSGFSAKRIAEELVALGRKKHTHIYVDGRIKEGNRDWSAASILSVLENEKKCGDVLAQKTYTCDPLLHKSRKNDQHRVKQYYALDQHTPIISRERYYLGLKLKKSNRGGWDDGIPVLRVCMKGAIKGFVLAVPRWYGFGAADYIKTSLTAYDIELPGEQILPDYVIDMMDGAKEPEEIEDKTKDENEDKPENHFYYVSEEEFNSSPAPEPEEYAAEDTDSEEDPWYRSLIRNLRNQQGLFEQTQNIYDRSVSARLFDINAKPLLTIDHLGVFFNKACLHALHGKEEENDLTGIVIFFNPIRRQILIKQSEKPDPARVLNWTKIEKNNIVMRRCPAGALASAIYECMNWITSTKYKVPGTVCTEEGDRYLLFDLSDSIAYVKLRKNTEQQNPQNGAGLEIDRRILPDDLNTLLSDIKDDTESGGSGIKPEVRSSAVYYESEAEEREIRSIVYTEISDLASKEYIEHLWGRNIREGCEQDYISDIVAQKGNCVQIMQPEWANSFCGRTVSRIPFSENEKNEFVDSGWTTEYKLPSPEEVERRLAELKKI